MSDDSALWVARAVEATPMGQSHPVVGGVISLGWVPVITTIGILYFERGEVSKTFALVQVLAASVVFFGPYQAWKYDQSVLPKFFDQIAPAVTDEMSGDLKQIRSERISEFRYGHVPTVFLWTLLVVSVLFVNADYFARQGIEPGAVSYVLYALFLVDFGVLSGLGLFSTWVSIKSIRQVSQLKINPTAYRQEGVRLLFPVGRTAAWTALLIANGSLAVPLAVEMVSGASGAFIVYSGVGIYALVISGCFFYPLGTVYFRVREFRREKVRECEKEIRELESALDQTASTQTDIEARATSADTRPRELAIRLRMENVWNRKREFSRTGTLPAPTVSIGKAVVSSVLPVFFGVVTELLSGLT